MWEKRWESSGVKGWIPSYNITEIFFCGKTPTVNYRKKMLGASNYSDVLPISVKVPGK